MQVGDLVETIPSRMPADTFAIGIITEIDGEYSDEGITGEQISLIRVSFAQWGDKWVDSDQIRLIEK